MQVTDIIQQVLLQNDTTHTTFVQQGNVARQENIGLAVNVGLPITKWWTPNLYVSAAYNDFKGIIKRACPRSFRVHSHREHEQFIHL